MPTTVNIAEFLKQQRESQWQREAQAQEERARHQDEIEGKTEERAAIAAEIEKKKSLITQNKAEGVDTAPLVKKVEELERRDACLASELQSLETRSEAADPEPPFDLGRASLLKDVLAQIGCEEATEARDLADCIQHLPLGLQIIPRGRHDDATFLTRGDLGVEVDPVGRPICCSVGLAANESLAIPIKPSEGHFFASYQPELLKWLPSDDAEGETKSGRGFGSRREDVLAFIDRETERLVLTRTNLGYHRRKYPHGTSEETVFERDEFADVATPLRPYLEGLLEDAGGSLDLAVDYHDNPLMAHLRAKLLPLTTAEPRFRPNAERLRSEEIAKRIKPDWDAFVHAPWSSAITGPLALAKHLLEAGERPRFWNEDFVGAYGMRLRTRDHDWLLATIYVASDGSPASNAEGVRVHSSRTADRYGTVEEEAIASHGRMSIRFRRSKE